MEKFLKDAALVAITILLASSLALLPFFLASGIGDHLGWW